MSNIVNLDRTISLLEKVLDLRQQNQQVIASNLANVDTPGYVPSRLEFEASLKQALAGGAATTATQAAHFPIGAANLAGVQGKVVQTPVQPAIGDRNGVDLEQEMIEMAENQLMYETATQLISKKLGILKYIAQDGR